MAIYLGIIFILFILNVIVGNYIYANKVVPELNKNDASEELKFLPSEQSKQIKKYLGILDRNGDKPWFYYLLKYGTAIAITLLIIWFSLMISMWE